MERELVAVRFHVSGRVQGVGFRAATRREAGRLGLNGHAVNCADGSVEVLAEGPADAVEALADWLHRGPPFAQVKRVARETSEPKRRQGFGVG
jgi:acylphosphatase